MGKCILAVGGYSDGSMIPYTGTETFVARLSEYPSLACGDDVCCATVDVVPNDRYIMHKIRFDYEESFLFYVIDGMLPIEAIHKMQNRYIKDGDKK